MPPCPSPPPCQITWGQRLVALESGFCIEFYRLCRFWCTTERYSGGAQPVQVTDGRTTRCHPHSRLLRAECCLAHVQPKRSKLACGCCALLQVGMSQAALVAAALGSFCLLCFLLVPDHSASLPQHPVKPRSLVPKLSISLERSYLSGQRGLAQPVGPGTCCRSGAVPGPRRARPLAAPWQRDAPTNVILHTSRHAARRSACFHALCAPRLVAAGMHHHPHATAHHQPTPCQTALRVLITHNRVSTLCSHTSSSTRAGRCPPSAVGSAAGGTPVHPPPLQATQHPSNSVDSGSVSCVAFSTQSSTAIVCASFETRASSAVRQPVQWATTGSMPPTQVWAPFTLLPADL